MIGDGGHCGASGDVHDCGYSSALVREAGEANDVMWVSVQNESEDILLSLLKVLCMEKL